MIVRTNCIVQFIIVIGIISKNVIHVCLVKITWFVGFLISTLYYCVYYINSLSLIIVQQNMKTDFDIGYIETVVMLGNEVSIVLTTQFFHTIISISYQ